MASTDLNELSSAQRQDLVNRMMGFINDAVVDDHIHITHSGAQLFTGHRVYIRRMETYLQQNGGGAFVPLPRWDPANPIPAEFNVVKPADDGTPYPPLENLNPNMPLPSAFRSPTVCGIQSAANLGNAINGWHGSVHVEIGGTMGVATIASAAPIFWCWHAFLDDVYAEWLVCPSHPAPLDNLLFETAAISNKSMPSGNVTRRLFKEWADWSKNNLKLKK